MTRNAPAPAQVKSYFARWSRLEEEKASLGEDSKELFAEAKSNGFNSKAMRAAFRKVRALETKGAEITEHESEVAVYIDAIQSGYIDAIQSGTPVANISTRAHTPVREADRSGPKGEPVVSEPAARSFDASAAPINRMAEANSLLTGKNSLANQLPDLPEFLDRRRSKTYSEASGR